MKFRKSLLWIIERLTATARLRFGLLRGATAQLCGLKAGANCVLAEGSKVTGHQRIEVGRNFYLGAKSHLKSMKRVAGADERTLIVGNDVFINEASIIDANYGISIGNDTIIGPMCVIIDSNHVFDSGSGPIRTNGTQYKDVRIGSGVWIGAHCVVLPGVEIGDNAVVAANSTVTRKVAPSTLVAGSPAKVIRTLQPR